MDFSILMFLFMTIVTNVSAFRCNVTYPPTTIDCSRLGLNNLPEHLKDHIATVMIFTHNKLDSNAPFNNWQNLRSIDVSYNSITNITSQTFKELINLKVLNISYNDIEEISEDTFDSLKVLEVLDLSGNPRIGFNYAKLQNLLNGTLYRSLKKFVMRSSGLNELPDTFFKYAIELQYLDLSHNNLTSIPALPDKLIHLDLSHNYITNVGIVPFHKKHSLRNIFLEYNVNLNNIDTDAFETTINLKNVSLKGCTNLTRLLPNLFYFNKNLKHLSIANCGLKTIPRQYKSIFTNLPSLELEDNPWVCNTSIKWFLTLDSAFIKNVRCREPTNSTILEFYGTSIHGAVLHQLLLVLVVIILILFGLALYLSFVKEKKKRLQNPYVPLHGKHPLHNPVYITTVV
ncbi:unnamed protein product [Nezara viridula]|uniref:Uncharacterized protein n=1 Tax=Nezara viridula TaxID=85310 RepID=A0A9P0H3M1_NEZVI|nr:unnamed protein product [Nezara viridula]